MPPTPMQRVIAIIIDAHLSWRLSLYSIREKPFVPNQNFTRSGKSNTLMRPLVYTCRMSRFKNSPEINMLSNAQNIYNFF